MDAIQTAAQSAAAIDLAKIIASQVAHDATINAYVSHGLSGVVISLLGILAFFLKGVLKRNDDDHRALFSHRHGVKIDDCRPPKCTGEAGDLTVPH